MRLTPSGSQQVPMRHILTVYLILYFVVIATAAATLWRSGLIEHLDRGWTLSVIAGGVMLGVLLRFGHDRELSTN